MQFKGVDNYGAFCEEFKADQFSPGINIGQEFLIDALPYEINSEATGQTYLKFLGNYGSSTPPPQNTTTPNPFTGGTQSAPINLSQYQNIQWAPDSREPKLMVATGVKGVGKSYSTILMLLNEYVRGDIPNGIMPRRCLILDVNNEYGEFGIDTMYPEDIAIFNVHPIVEIRRIVPFVHDQGKARKMTNAEIVKLLEYILDNFKGGCLLIEDPNKYQGSKMTDDVIGSLCTNRHYDCDIVLHYQSASRPAPAIWVNANVVRFHHQQDDIFRSDMKLVEKTEMFKIAQLLVDKKYYAGDKRFYVWINIDENKIIGNFTTDQFKDACQEYISLSQSIYRQFLNKIGGDGRKMYTPEQAINECKNYLLIKYWGNHLN